LLFMNNCVQIVQYLNQFLNFIGVKSNPDFDFRLSLKKIDLPYDKGLYNKCIELYNYLNKM